jgi:3D (Asp-Asp-Asp) domain-containing protein
MLKIILIGILQVTSYQPVPQQTRAGCNGIHDCFTSVGDVPTKFGAAASQDLLANGTLHYGDPIYVQGIGWRIINDTMNPRHRNAIDVMVWTRGDEHAIGVRHARVYTVQR